MKRLLVLALGLSVLAAGAGPRQISAGTAALPCGLPQGQPLWVDFADGAVPFWSTVFARPGIVAGAANFIVPPQLRAGGAKTIYFDLNFHNRMGPPSNPVDPASITDRADRLFDTAAQSSACDKPLIALNELFGAQAPAPWTPTTAQYRANVLAFVKRLAERGARPFLLLSNRPYIHGEAADWWREVAGSADLVLEVYFNGPAIWKQGSARGSLRLRSNLRSRIADLTEIGVPPSRIGVMLTFSSTPKAGGREGLTPLARWLDVVKWEALAAKAVAAETKIASVWSWGWATYAPSGNDPDKAIAACVWLWTRDRSLCDAPAVAAARNFDQSLDVGVAMPPGALCLLGDAPLWRSVVTGLTRLTHDAEIARSAALQRLVLTKAAGVSAADAAAAERRVIADRFRGRKAAYLAALSRAGAALSTARAILADELRRQAVERSLHVSLPTLREIADYYARFDGTRARLVRSNRPLPWLGNRRSGVAIAGIAPARILALPPGATAVVEGAQITAVGETVALGALPLAAATPAVRAALVDLARVDAFRTWASRRLNQARAQLECTNDAFPQPTPVDLTQWLPFLALA